MYMGMNYCDWRFDKEQFWFPVEITCIWVKLSATGTTGDIYTYNKGEEMIMDDDVENIMSGGRTVFLNNDVLRRGYTPKSLSDVKHRKDIIETYAFHMQPVMEHSVPANLFLYGKSGTGKTMLTKLMMNKTKELAYRSDIKFLSIEINCETNRSDSKILRALASTIENEIGVKPARQCNDLGDFFEWFCQLVDLHSGVITIIFDEIDKIRNPDIINSFSRLVENDNTKRNVAMICITNDIQFTDRLDGRTRNALGETEIIFTPYDAEQLADILTARAELAFKPGALGECVIQLCAARAAQERGDARTAIDLLRNAGIAANKRNSNVVEVEDVDTAYHMIEDERVNDIIKSLPTQSKLVLAAVMLLKLKLNQQRTYTGEVYQVYRAMCTECGMDMLTQRRVSDLLSELDQLGIVNAILTSRGRYGRTKEVVLQVSRAHLKTLALDARMTHVLDFDNLVKHYKFGNTGQTHLQWK